MPIPDFQSLMRPVLMALSDQSAIPIADLRKRIQTSEDLDESDCRKMLPSGRQTVFANRIHWALTHLAKAGLIERPIRGSIKLTNSGKSCIAEGSFRIDQITLRSFPKYREWEDSFTGPRTDGGENSEGDEDDRTPIEMIEQAAGRLRSMLEAEVLESILKCPSTFLEKVVIDLLIAMGYGGGNAEMGSVTGGPGDGGIDGNVREDALGLNEIYMQAKKYDRGNSVNASHLREFAGALDVSGTDKGVFVTTSNFNGAALDYVKKSNKRIVLIDGKELARLMVMHGVGVRPRTTYEIKQIDKDYYGLE